MAMAMKKVRQREEDPPDRNTMAMEEDMIGQMTFKAMFLGGKSVFGKGAYVDPEEHLEIGFSDAMYKKSLLKAKGNIIGQVIKVDDNAENESRGRFASHDGTSHEQQPVTTDLDKRAKGEAFGSWMVVAKKFKRKSKKPLDGSWTMIWHVSHTCF
ncbi:hypothetical protein GOBAR_AA09702 [Gossypium barbadense]|uniref:Uncharacterized protein n=1 Tax=Gossypium barbadense TaxID=3634 RepID=A0A2P5Y5S5_GOSBA|nr:hypothetical protein GOBAR_AA09702 [Gossypium barbadense]